MIAGTIWRLLLVAIGLVTIGVQVDRQTRRTPALAQSVPAPFRSAAQLPVAAYALAGDDPAFALAEAERLVRRRPLPAEHLRVLAQAQFASGELDESTLSVQYAAQRGWRDPLAQEAMLRLALAAGNAPEAARRYAALFLRRDTKDALLEELGQPVLEEAGGEGRKTLIEIVGGGDRWHNQFLNRGPRVMPPDAFVEITAASIRDGAQFSCGALGNAVKVIIRRDASASAPLVEAVKGKCSNVAG